MSWTFKPYLNVHSLETSVESKSLFPEQELLILEKLWKIVKYRYKKNQPKQAYTIF